MRKTSKYLPSTTRITRIRTTQPTRITQKSVFRTQLTIIPDHSSAWQILEERTETARRCCYIWCRRQCRLCGIPLSSRLGVASLSGTNAHRLIGLHLAIQDLCPCVTYTLIMKRLKCFRKAALYRRNHFIGSITEHDFDSRPDGPRLVE